MLATRGNPSLILVVLIVLVVLDLILVFVIIVLIQFILHRLDIRSELGDLSSKDVEIFGFSRDFGLQEQGCARTFATTCAFVLAALFRWIDSAFGGVTTAVTRVARRWRWLTLGTSSTFILMAHVFFHVVFVAYLSVSLGLAIALVQAFFWPGWFAFRLAVTSAFATTRAFMCFDLHACSFLDVLTPATAFTARFGGRRRLGRHWCRGHCSREKGPLRRRRRLWCRCRRRRRSRPHQCIVILTTHTTTEVYLSLGRAQAHTKSSTLFFCVS